MSSEATDPKVPAQPTRTPPAAFVEQMKLIVEHADKLVDFVQKSSAIAPALSPDGVVRKLVSSTGLDFKSLYAIFNAIDNLNTLKKEYGSPDRAIDNLLAAFGETAVPGIESKRRQIRDALAIYSEDNPVAISLKAQRIIYLHEKMFVDAEVITDARPVFNSSAEKVLEYVITHSLLVTYHEDDGAESYPEHRHSRVHISLDFDDLVTLRKACERAILKAQTLQKDLGDRGRMLGGDQ